ncbi:hypothetical protein [Streptomyces laurentii]|uniref:hypothetical protein n=1 Tax=Streptomyces laurentii TaxID=39478 RepID=UPI0036939CA5
MVEVSSRAYDAPPYPKRHTKDFENGKIDYKGIETDQDKLTSSVAWTVEGEGAEKTTKFWLKVGGGNARSLQKGSIGVWVVRPDVNKGEREYIDITTVMMAVSSVGKIDSFLGMIKGDFGETSSDFSVTGGNILAYRIVTETKVTVHETGAAHIVNHSNGSQSVDWTPVSTGENTAIRHEGGTKGWETIIPKLSSYEETNYREPDDYNK